MLQCRLRFSSKFWMCGGMVPLVTPDSSPWEEARCGMTGIWSTELHNSTDTSLGNPHAWWSDLGNNQHHSVSHRCSLAKELWQWPRQSLNLHWESERHSAALRTITTWLDLFLQLCQQLPHWISLQLNRFSPHPAAAHPGVLSGWMKHYQNKRKKIHVK